MPKVVDLVAPGGILMAETFLEAQKAFGWGPSSDDHLLRTGELFKLVAPARRDAWQGSRRSGGQRTLECDRQRAWRSESNGVTGLPL